MSLGYEACCTQNGNRSILLSTTCHCFTASIRLCSADLFVILRLSLQTENSPALKGSIDQERTLSILFRRFGGRIRPLTCSRTGSGIQLLPHSIYLSYVQSWKNCSARQSVNNTPITHPHHLFDKFNSSSPALPVVDLPQYRKSSYPHFLPISQDNSDIERRLD
jgi:hypothetical protein